MFRFLLLVVIFISFAFGADIECHDDICYWGRQGDTLIDPTLKKPQWISHPTKPFQIGSTEITILQYKECVSESV